MIHTIPCIWRKSDQIQNVGTIISYKGLYVSWACKLESIDLNDIRRFGTLKKFSVVHLPKLGTKKISRRKCMGLYAFFKIQHSAFSKSGNREKNLSRKCMGLYTFLKIRASCSKFTEFYVLWQNKEKQKHCEQMKYYF